VDAHDLTSILARGSSKTAVGAAYIEVSSFQKGKGHVARELERFLRGLNQIKWVKWGDIPGNLHSQEPASQHAMTTPHHAATCYNAASRHDKMPSGAYCSTRERFILDSSAHGGKTQPLIYSSGGGGVKS
jgi:hypothetical protein